MSLAVAIITDQNAIVVSDGLIWRNDSIIAQDFSKQIQLGNDVLIASCGLATTTVELFGKSQRAYEIAKVNKFDPLEAVKGVLTITHSIPAPANEKQSRPNALLVAKTLDGMYGAAFGAGGQLDEYRIKPGDKPTIIWLSPSDEISKRVVCSLAPKVLFSRYQPEEFLAAMREALNTLFDECSRIHTPPKNSSVFNVSVIGDDSTDAPAPQRLNIESLQGAVANSLAPNSVSTAGGQSATATPISTAETQVLSVSPSIIGGSVFISARANFYNTGTAAYSASVAIYRGDNTGTLLGSAQTFVPVNSSGYAGASASAFGVDTNTTAGTTYTVYCQVLSGSSSGASADAELTFLNAAR